jgi:adenosylcobinamide kinase/adenosylcobinamide-phosphate guanylyltransferase
MTSTLVLGGARSGKSAYAERLVTSLPPPWTYIATAEALDGEMAERIAVHRARRGEGWGTLDCALDLAGTLARADLSDRPVLVDCLTLWVSNLMLGDHDTALACDRLETALAARTAATVLVSNEVGLGIVPENALARRFRDEAGRVNQRIAKVADRVIFVVAGLPMTIK